MCAHSIQALFCLFQSFKGWNWARLVINRYLKKVKIEWNGFIHATNKAEVTPERVVPLTFSARFVLSSILSSDLYCAVRFSFTPCILTVVFFLRLTYFFACMVYASSHRNICVTSVYTSRDSFFGLPSSHLLLFCFIVVRNTLRAYVVLDVCVQHRCEWSCVEIIYVCRQFSLSFSLYILIAFYVHYVFDVLVR